MDNNRVPLCSIFLQVIFFTHKLNFSGYVCYMFQIIDNVKMLIEEMKNLANQKNILEEGAKQVIHDAVLSSQTSVRIAGNLHLFMLLFQVCLPVEIFCKRFKFIYCTRIWHQLSCTFHYF